MQRNQTNHRSARIVEVGGELMNISAAARYLNMPVTTLHSRLYRGWTDDCAVRTSNEKRKPHRQTLRRLAVHS